LGAFGDRHVGAGPVQADNDARLPLFAPAEVYIGHVVAAARRPGRRGHGIATSGDTQDDLPAAHAVVVGSRLRHVHHQPGPATCGGCLVLLYQPLPDVHCTGTGIIARFGEVEHDPGGVLRREHADLGVVTADLQRDPDAAVRGGSVVDARHVGGRECSRQGQDRNGQNHPPEKSIS
jgi:hypothetical protein